MDFNPHHYESGDAHSKKPDEARNNFNPHHYESGDQVKSNYREWINNFNPHHYESGDFILSSALLFANISIHTTTRVVTAEGAGQLGIKKISIHTTTRVVTFEPHLGIKTPLIFQSTPLREW